EGEDVALVGQSNSILVSCSQTGDDAGGWSLFLLEADATELATVRIRRLRYVQAPVFDTSGLLYFTGDGDIWRGSIDREEESHSLTAIRIAPVATRETQNATPAQMGAQELAL